MAELFFLFIVIVALTLTLTGLVINLPAHPGIKVFALALAAALVVNFYLSGSELLGRAKPARLALLERGADEVSVVSALNVEGKAIYLWLIFPGDTAPRAYSMPWSDEAAEALRKAQDEAEINGSTVRMRNPFLKRSTDKDEQFFAPPPPPMPPKPAA